MTQTSPAATSRRSPCNPPEPATPTRPGAGTPFDERVPSAHPTHCSPRSLSPISFHTILSHYPPPICKIYYTFAYVIGQFYPIYGWLTIASLCLPWVYFRELPQTWPVRSVQGRQVYAPVFGPEPPILYQVRQPQFMRPGLVGGVLAGEAGACSAVGRGGNAKGSVANRPASKPPT
jgi:hypothetical protein